MLDVAPTLKGLNSRRPPHVPEWLTPAQLSRQNQTDLTLARSSAEAGSRDTQQSARVGIETLRKRLPVDFNSRRRSLQPGGKVASLANTNRELIILVTLTDDRRGTQILVR